MKLLLYCTKQKPYLINLNTKYFISSDKESLGYIDKKDMKNFNLNGKIVAECDYDVEEITNEKLMQNETDYDLLYETNSLFEKDLLKQSCLTYKELDDYLEGKNGYAIHIKNLHIFDKPKELNEFSYYSAFGYLIKDMAGITNGNGVDRAPQNMMRVMDEKDIYFLISIHPEWLCKILNGEKTIEVRKKLLKEML